MTNAVGLASSSRFLSSSPGPVQGVLLIGSGLDNTNLDKGPSIRKEPNRQSASRPAIMQYRGLDGARLWKDDPSGELPDGMIDRGLEPFVIFGEGLHGFTVDLKRERLSPT